MGLLLKQLHIRLYRLKEVIFIKIKELIRDGNSIVFNGDYLDIYLRKEYFKKGLAEHRGSYISAFGMFIFEIRTDKQVKDSADGVKHHFKFPNKIEFNYTEHFELDLQLEGDERKEKYDVFRLTNGNQFMANVNIEQSATAVRDFVFLFHSGKLPSFIKYNDIIKLYYDVLDSNKTNLKSNSLTYEIIISELCRYNKDVEKPYRLALDKDPGPYDYINYNLKKLPRLNSTFASLTFEGIDDSIVSSVRRTSQGGTEKESPLERVIKY